MVWFGVLGPLSAANDNAAIAVTAAKQRIVLAALLLHANHVVSFDDIAPDVWDDEPSQVRTRDRAQLRASATAGPWTSCWRPDRHPRSRLPDRGRRGRARPAAVRQPQRSKAGPPRGAGDWQQAFAPSTMRWGCGGALPWPTCHRSCCSATRFRRWPRPGCRRSNGGSKRSSTWPSRRRRDRDSRPPRPCTRCANVSTSCLMLALYRCGRQADALAAYRRVRRRWPKSWASSRARSCADPRPDPAGRPEPDVRRPSGLDYRARSARKP